MTLTAALDGGIRLPLRGDAVLPPNTGTGLGAHAAAAPLFDLSLSENPFPPLPSVRAALAEVAEHANRYPEFLPLRLCELIAERVGVSPEQVVVGAGATGVALQVMQAVLRPGHRMVFATPTFDGYPILARIAGVAPVGVPLDESGRQVLPALAQAVDGRTDLVVLCRPHNPTGTLVDGDELDEFLRAVPDRVTVLLDEAYVEFLDEDDALNTLRLIATYPNVLVLRTFSKAFGLAGLRIGYAFGARARIERVRCRQLPFAMNVAAVPAVAASYAAERELCERVTRITDAR
jgi:histidinol-phosphate aminotransferase